MPHLTCHCGLGPSPTVRCPVRPYASPAHTPARTAKGARPCASGTHDALHHQAHFPPILAPYTGPLCWPPYAGPNAGRCEAGTSAGVRLSRSTLLCGAHFGGTPRRFQGRHQVEAPALCNKIGTDRRFVSSVGAPAWLVAASRSASLLTDRLLLHLDR